MVIPTHDELIRAKMLQLANVTTQAQDRITGAILSNAATAVRDSLGDDGYNDFLNSLAPYLVPVVVPGEGEEEDTEYLPYTLFDAKTFDNLTSDEKSLRNLLHAESYFGLYNLAIALKKLVKGNTNTIREQAGGTSISAAPFDDLISNAETYREQAINCLSSAIGLTDDDSVFADGSLGMFIV